MKRIGLSAVDGAGKTTATRAVERRLGDDGERIETLHWPNDSLVALLPRKSGRLTSRVAATVGNDRLRSEVGRTTVPGNGGGRSGERAVVARLRGAAFASLLVLAFCLVLVNEQVMRVALPLRYPDADRIVLDRSAFDDLVHLEYLGLPASLVDRGIAAIDTTGISLIDVPPAVAMARDSGVDGSDHPPSYYPEKVALYRRYADRHGIARLDGTDEVDVLCGWIVRGSP